MLFRSGPTTEVTLTMRASPRAIWEACIDPTVPVVNSPELIAAEWDPDGPPPGLGARLLGRNRRGETEWSTTSHVVEWESCRSWSYEVGVGQNAASRWWYTLDDHGDGTVTVSQKVRLGPGTSGLTEAIDRKPELEETIIERRLEFMAAAMRGNLEEIEARAAS
ncbi:MAG: SRPBCC family protein [Acidimicrobiales bacterium]